MTHEQHIAMGILVFPGQCEHPTCAAARKQMAKDANIESHNRGKRKLATRPARRRRERMNRYSSNAEREVRT